MSEPLPTHARAIVVGGGVIGTSTAYHLAKAGWSDILETGNESFRFKASSAAASAATKKKETTRNLTPP